MRKIRELLRLHFTMDLSQHQIAASLSLSVGVVNKYVRLAQAAGMAWPLPTELEDDVALKRVLTPLKEKVAVAPLDFAAIHTALKHKGVTLQLLWEEYCTTVSEPYSNVSLHTCVIVDRAHIRHLLSTCPKHTRNIWAGHQDGF